jgi:redox-sensitive bicupin YhaK (pirin superfamily)
MLEIRLANQRGRGDHGRLRSRHTFSFANYYDPHQVGFSDLLLINEDRVAAGQGFGTHPHRAREIFLYVLEGALEHKDSTGSGSITRPGDVQLMRAGTGVAHSEYNDSSTPVHFLQIWINPALRNTMPLYRQQHFAAEERRGRLRLILSPDAAQGSLSIQHDARVYAGLLDGP